MHTGSAHLFLAYQIPFLLGGLNDAKTRTKCQETENKRIGYLVPGKGERKKKRQRQKTKQNYKKEGNTIGEGEQKENDENKTRKR